MKKFHWLLYNPQVLIPTMYIVCLLFILVILDNFPLFNEDGYNFLYIFSLLFLHLPVLIIASIFPLSPKRWYFNLQEHPSNFGETIIISLVCYFILGLLLKYLIQFLSQCSRKGKYISS